ncbi:hypothetical protein J6W34_09265 [bacterium]|nr:hypothetical protein [bacterium]
MNKPIKLYFDYKNCKDGDIHCPNCNIELNTEDVKDECCEMGNSNIDYMECPNCGIHLFPIDSDNDDKNEYYYKLIYGE